MIITDPRPLLYPAEGAPQDGLQSGELGIQNEIFLQLAVTFIRDVHILAKQIQGRAKPMLG